MAYNEVKLHGGQICDYLYIQDGELDSNEFFYVNDQPSEWGDTTALLATFEDADNPLKAGNSDIVGLIDNYEVYRKRDVEPYAKYVGTIKKSENDVVPTMIDYGVKNGMSYSYYLYPSVEASKSGTKLSPVVTDVSKVDGDFWSLFIVDESDEPNVFYLDKMFKFEFNLQESDIKNNAQISIMQNFTKYPTIQHGSSNYWSGTLSSLCGVIDVIDNDYVQDTDMISELKAISSDIRKKFLKDIDGNLWEVDVSEPISIATDTMTLQRIKTVSISWVEVGDAENISIINNPNKSLTEWVLTKTGKVYAEFNYVWDKEYVWNNDYYWTSKEEGVQLLSLGENTELLGQGGYVYE